MNVGLIGHIDICDLQKILLSLAEIKVGLFLISPKRFGNNYEMPIGVKDVDINMYKAGEEMRAHEISCIVGNPVAGIDYENINDVIEIIKKKNDLYSKLEFIVRNDHEILEQESPMISHKCERKNTDKIISQQGWKSKKRFL